MVTVSSNQICLAVKQGINHLVFSIRRKPKNVDQIRELSYQRLHEFLLNHLNRRKVNV